MLRSGTEVSRQLATVGEGVAAREKDDDEDGRVKGTTVVYQVGESRVIYV